MNRIATWGTRAAITAGAFALVVGVGAGTAFAADSPGSTGAKGPKGAALSALVTAGTITEAQKATFRYEMDEVRQAAVAAGTSTDCAVIEAAALSALVSEGALTQAQADAIKAARPARPQGTARTGAAEGTRGGPLAALVANGTITQAQADAIKAAHPERSGAGGRGAQTTPQTAS
ncbi:hypothetical protein LBMAG15_08190 [Actinomycetes bacterium]|nr:hypothetical protein LBMAG15_08190 [Actinomycetes bacterium]